eukprot:CAMPEP_0172703622 /NCGR_PEP_ID=MMETSP1074-20121228/38212_1 /TAXON_ID=2916 /ORGANISM="Ceratium fusus, Strain PA161109" /LENGTH=45 /DNA_ID= /DNA_START= /DNA_END= /DNA_ORIENTATION=
MSSVSSASGAVSMADFSCLMTAWLGLISRMAWFREPIAKALSEAE